MRIRGVLFLLILIGFVIPASALNLSATNGTHISPPWPVQFMDVSGIAGVAYNWTFGDGGTSTEQNPVHTYTTTGVFNVTFQIIDAANVIYDDNKTGFVFSTKDGLPVAFDGFSDEFDNEDSILLYNGTTPITDYWGIVNFEGHTVLNSTGLRKIISVDYNGSAIFYAPPFNGSTEFYKYNYLDEGIFTWNIHVNDTSYFGQHYFFWNTNDTTLYPPEYWDPVNIIETDAIWMRTQENATELWLKTDVLRSKISEPNIPRWEYHNITVIMDSSTAGAAEYVNGTYYIETTSGVFTRGFAGIGTREDPSVYPLIPTAEYSDILRIDNWSFNYQNAPRAAFTYEQPDTSSWWSSESVPTVQFTDASNNAGYSATGWYWEFGDGTISTEQNPRHTYSTAGSYNVNLRVDTPEGFDWVLNETISSGTPYVSPWDNSTRATQMMTDTIVMGMIVFVLGATVAVVVAHLK